MTEEKAKTRWCPMYRVSVVNGGGRANNNRMNFNDQVFERCHCIASGCMLWVSHFAGAAEGHCGLVKQ